MGWIISPWDHFERPAEANPSLIPSSLGSRRSSQHEDHDDEN